MNVIVAKSAGFCFGVQRAVDILYEEVKKGTSPLYTYGPIIHNETVVSDLESRGVKVIESKEELLNTHEGTVVIRTHGVGPDVYEIIEKNGLRLVDATCPFVKKIHKVITEKVKEGYDIIVAGDAAHPEVTGIVGWGGNGHVSVVDSPEMLENYDNPEERPVCLVAQTTFNAKKFQYLVEVCKKKMYTVNVVNTICNATNERQEETRRIASASDAMIVIGGRNSSNTRKLYEISREQCEDTYFIQTLEDFAFRRVDGIETVGITAGASTPKNIIKEVQTYVRDGKF